jgi:hypothetical protein
MKAVALAFLIAAASATTSFAQAEHLYLRCKYTTPKPSNDLIVEVMPTGIALHEGASVTYFDNHTERTPYELDVFTFHITETLITFKRDISQFIADKMTSVAVDYYIDRSTGLFTITVGGNTSLQQTGTCSKSDPPPQKF